MKLAKTYPIRLVCRLLGVPRSSVYYPPQACPRCRGHAQDRSFGSRPAEWPTYGYRRLTAMMRRLDWPVNGKRVRRWMQELGIHGTPPTRTRHAPPTATMLFRVIQTSSKTWKLRGQIKFGWPTSPTSDLRREFIYLAILMDVFTRSIRGWHLSRGLDQGLTLAALERALVVAVPRCIIPTKACSMPPPLTSNACRNSALTSAWRPSANPARTATPNGSCAPSKKRRWISPSTKTSPMPFGKSPVSSTMSTTSNASTRHWAT